MRISNSRIDRIITESIYKVLVEDETALNSTGSDVSSSLSKSDASADSNGTKSYATSVSNLSDTSKGDDMVITGKNNTEVQNKLQKSKANNPSFYSNPANKVHFKVNPNGNFNF